MPALAEDVVGIVRGLVTEGCVGMGRYDPVELIRTEGPAAFGFLVEEFGFADPERIEGGIVYRRPDLHIEIAHWVYKNEAGFSTTVIDPGDIPGSRRSASLGCLFVACGLGAAQAVPEQSGAGHTIRKRIAQHARALRQVIPVFDGVQRDSLLRRCRGGDLPAEPDPELADG